MQTREEIINSLEKWDDESLSYFGLIFQVGVFTRRSPLEEPTFDDFVRFGTQKSTEIGVDEKGLYFMATGPVRCYLKDKGITWAFRKEDFLDYSACVQREAMKAPERTTNEAN